MVSSLVAKVMWVGRATVFLVGLAVIVAAVLWVVSMALGVNGNPLIPANSDQRNGISQQVGSGGADHVLAMEPVAKRRVPSQGFARVELDGDVDPSRSKEVKDIVIPAGQTNLYCFDLTFRPKVAVGSPYIVNSADIATSTQPDGSPSPLNSTCPAEYRDLAVKTYGSTGEAAAVNFDIVFMR